MPAVRKPRSNRLQQIGGALIAFAAVYALFHSRYGLPKTTTSWLGIVAIGAGIPWA